MKKKPINLINKINLIVNKKNLIKPNKFILVSVSGGQDSIGLLFFIFQLKNQWNWSIGIIYCNHLWQKDSFYSSSLILNLAFLFEIPFYVILTSKKICSEQKSRKWRYQVFQRLSFFYEYQIITTGHTSTDRVETLLFQMIRGTSTKGLTSLNWIRENSRFKKNILQYYFHEIFLQLENTHVKQPSLLFQKNCYNLPNFNNIKLNALFFKQTYFTSRLFFSSQLMFQNFTQLSNFKQQTFFQFKNNECVKFYVNQTLVCNSFPEIFAFPVSSTQPLPSEARLRLGFINRRLLEIEKSISRNSRQPRSIRVFPALLILQQSSLASNLASAKRLSRLLRWKNLPNWAKLFYFVDKGNDNSWTTRFKPANQNFLCFYSISFYPLNYMNKIEQNKSVKKKSLFFNEKWFDHKILIVCSKKYSLKKHLYFNTISSKLKVFNIFHTPKHRYNHTQFCVFFSVMDAFVISSKSSNYLQKSKSAKQLEKIKQKLFLKNWKRESVCQYTELRKNNFLFHFLLCNFFTLPKKFYSNFPHVIWQRSRINGSALVLTDYLPQSSAKNLSQRFGKVKSFYKSSIYCNPASVLLRWQKADKRCLNIKKVERAQNLICLKQSSKVILKFHMILYWQVFKQKFLLIQFFKKNQFSVKLTKNKVLFENCLFLTFLSTSMLINRRFINRSPAFYFVDEAGLDLLKVNPVNEKLMVTLQAGTYSLNSMIVRPFLILSRFDVKKLVNFWKLPIYPDKTNQKLRYHRNRIRKQLLPLLRFFFNPQVDNLFLQFSEIATSEQLYLDFVATRLFHEFATLKKNVLKLDISLFYFIPIAIRRKLLKEFLSMYSTKQIKFVYIEILLSSIEQHKKHSFNNSQFGQITKRVHQKTTVTSNYFVKTRKKFNKNYFGLNIYTLSLNLPALQIQSFDCIYIQDFFVTKAKRSHLNLLFFPKLGALFILGGRIIALL